MMFDPTEGMGIRDFVKAHKYTVEYVAFVVTVILILQILELLKR